MLLNNRKSAWKSLMITLVAVLMVSLIAGCGQKNEGSAAKGDQSKVVATYKGGTITENEFNKEISMMTLLYPQYAQVVTMDEFREYLLKQEIAYKILADKATDAAKKDGEKKAKEQLDQMKKAAGDQYKTELDKLKLTDQDVLAYMTRLLTVVADYNAKVTDDQVKAEFEKNKQNFTTASVRHVLIALETQDGKTKRTKEEALKRAKEVEAKLKAPNADWNKIAKEYSDDGGSKDNGGLYKDAAVGQWVEEFKKAAVELPLNKISDPVESQFGYHVMKVESRVEMTFDKLTADQKESLRGQVSGASMNQFMEKELPGLITKIDLPKVEKKEEPKQETGKKTDEKTEPTSDKK
ncbi:peptidylprolyl isomerase [Paenibacillus terrigena]|uniref:peptidylprolyl isomerase n=1 Tax=Paenibacillus terrigena TaxID=369333 RepID=UPI0028D040B5|nr:peptidylprolyl isomerase [Paenibacillus terrigena]